MPEVVNEVFRTVSKKLHTENRYTNYLKSIENTLGFKREYIFTMTVLLVGAYLSVGESAEFICNLATVIYPTCASIKAIEQNNSEAVQKMLIYWAIFGILRFVEYFSNVIRCWIPCYWIFKVVLLLLCFIPIPNNLGTYIYYQILLPRMQNIINMLMQALVKDTQIVATATKELALTPFESHRESIFTKGDIQVFDARQSSAEFKKLFEEKSSKLSIDQKDESKISSLFSNKEVMSSNKKLSDGKIGIQQSILSSQGSDPVDIQQPIKQDTFHFPSILLSAEEDPFALPSHKNQASTQSISEYLPKVPSREMKVQLPITLSQNSVISDKKVPIESSISKRTPIREEPRKASVQKESSFIEIEKNKFPEAFPSSGQMSSASITVEKQASRSSSVQIGKNIPELLAPPSMPILAQEQASRNSIKIADTKIPKISSRLSTEMSTERMSNASPIQNQILRDSIQMEHIKSKISPVSSEQLYKKSLQDSYPKLQNISSIHGQSLRTSLQLDNEKVPKVPSISSSRISAKQEAESLPVPEQTSRASVQSNNAKVPKVSSISSSWISAKQEAEGLPVPEQTSRASVQSNNAKVPKIPSISSSRISAKQKTEVVPVQKPTSRTSFTKVIETPEVSRHSSIKEILNIQQDQEEINETIEITLPEKNIVVSDSQEIQLKRLPTDEELFKETPEATLIPSKLALNTLAESIKETKIMDD